MNEARFTRGVIMSSEGDISFNIQESDVLTILKSREFATSEEITMELSISNKFNETINHFLQYMKEIGKIEYKHNKGWMIKNETRRD